MPELPDLLYIKEYLDRSLVGSTVKEVDVRRPVVLRNMLSLSPTEALRGKALAAVEIRGPFLRLAFPPVADLIINLMLSGRLHHQRQSERAPGHLCMTIRFSEGSSLHLSDDQQMAKVYLVAEGNGEAIPAYAHQGVEILGPTFTLELFRGLVERNRRKQVRVMINDHAILSSIGNAYADEILFEAGLHPKTIVARLTAGDVERLFSAILLVMSWGTEKVREAAQPIHVKVRDHMRVRNRHGEPCPRCGTTIRREGVRGYDVFFCPHCQPATRKTFIDWEKGN